MQTPMTAAPLPAEQVAAAVAAAATHQRRISRDTPAQGSSRPFATTATVNNSATATLISTTSCTTVGNISVDVWSSKHKIKMLCRSVGLLTQFKVMPRMVDRLQLGLVQNVYNTIYTFIYYIFIYKNV